MGTDQQGEKKFLSKRKVSWTGLLLLSVLILGVGVGCNPQPNPETQEEVVREEKMAQTLKIAVIPAVSPEEQQDQLDNLSSYLEESLNQSVQVEVSPDYDAAVEALVSGEVQIAFLGPFTYIKAHDRDPNLTPIVAAINASTGRPWYQSFIVTRSGSGISNLEGLPGKRFAFANESSTSGFLVPSVHFQEIGLTPETDFAEVIYSGSHDQSLGLLQGGTVDAIAIDSEVFQTAKDRGQIQDSDYEIIWKSDPIPTEPIVVSDDLPDSVVIELKKALINAPQGMFDVSGSESIGYTLVDDTDYEPIRKIYRAFSDQLNKS